MSRSTAPSSLPCDHASHKEGQHAPVWPPHRRLAASALIALHVTAVFLPPLAFACRGEFGSSSPFADGLASWLRPYSQLMYLDHGYFFFAPNPGPSHLVRYRAEFDDGRPPVEGTFPHLATQRPRLIYHRHFMLAEYLHALYAPPEPPPEIPIPGEIATSLTEPQRTALADQFRRQHAQQVQLWRHQRRQYEAFGRSLAQHLKRSLGASRVTLARIEHRQPTPDEFDVVGRLDWRATYRELPEGPLAPEVVRP
jgi:hypothetical protein